MKTLVISLFLFAIIGQQELSCVSEGESNDCYISLGTTQPPINLTPSSCPGGIQLRVNTSAPPCLWLGKADNSAPTQIEFGESSDHTLTVNTTTIFSNATGQFLVSCWVFPGTGRIKEVLFVLTEDGTPTPHPTLKPTQPGTETDNTGTVPSPPNKAAPQPPTGSSPPTLGIVVGAVVGALSLIILVSVGITILLVCYRNTISNWFRKERSRGGSQNSVAVRNGTFSLPGKATYSYTGQAATSPGEPDNPFPSPEQERDGENRESSILRRQETDVDERDLRRQPKPSSLRSEGPFSAVALAEMSTSYEKSNAAQAGPNEETLVEPDDNVAGSCTQEDRSGLSDMVA